MDMAKINTKIVFIFFVWERERERERERFECTE